MRIDEGHQIPRQDRGLRLRISPRRAVAVLGTGAVLLIAGGILAEISRVGFDRGRLFGLVPLFDLDGEANLPATYSAGLLALAAAAVWLTAAWRRQVGASHVGHMRFLSLLLLLLFMAFDEASQVHELLSAPVRSALELSGPLYYAWVVVYGAIVLALAMVFVPLVRHLEPRTRTSLLTAASLYVGGALGLELAGSGVADAGGRGSWSYAVLTTIEESLEMTGVLLLLYVLLTCLRTACGEVNARLVATADAPARPGLREGSPA